MAADEPPGVGLWKSACFPRWTGTQQPMPPSRQKELIEGYVATLPELPGRCPRALQAPSREDVRQTLRRDERVELAPSAMLPTLT